MNETVSQVSMPRKTKPFLKVALALSLAVNLAIAGTFAGVALRGESGGPRAASAARDFSFGPFSASLTKEQRRALRHELAAAGIGPREMHAQLRADMVKVLEGLKAAPFDGQALTATMRDQGERMAQQSEAVRGALVAVILQMSDRERADFSARLEQHLDRRGPMSAPQAPEQSRPNSNGG